MTRSLPLLVVVSLAAACSDAGAQGPVTVKQTCETPDAGAEYPPCPYSENATLDGVIPNKKFVGRMAGIDSPREDIDFARLYALRKEGKKFLVYNVAAFWCSPCKEEAKEFQNILLPKYGPKGVVFFSVVFEDAARSPATDANIDTWISTFRATFPVVRDVEGWTAKIFNVNSMPFNMIVDLEDMKVKHQVVGAQLQSITDKLDQLLAQ
jgi:thiol-disulfide isomerase/thioredoxin